MKKLLVSLLLIAAALFAIGDPPAARAAERPTYYLDANSARYETYQAQNPSMPFDKVVAYVNANVDKGFYKDIETVANPASIRALINKHYALPSDYEPADLVSLGDGRQLRAEAAEAFNKMKASAKDLGLNLVVRSAYRSYATQTATHNSFLSRYSKEYAEKQSARAGHSEHQLGLAVDVVQKVSTGPLGNNHFEQTKEYAFLQAHGHEYGFILRYPKGLSDIHGYIYEPWHWRYVGTGVATAMHNEGIDTLEEYYGKYLAPGLPARSNLTASPIASVVQVDGVGLSFDAYNIGGNNYFKLRDLAWVLSGTAKQFEVNWNAAANTIALTTGWRYTPVGGEMIGKGAGNKTPVPTSAKILLDGRPVTLTAYNIGGNNYFKLRDIGQALDFGVDWDAARNTVVIDTSRGYTPG